jgi:apolipoprotein N-acyltransferase
VFESRRARQTFRVRLYLFAIVVRSTSMDSHNAKSDSVIFMALAAVVSAAAYFWGTGLHPHWWLTWLAPLPILVLAPRLPHGHAVAIAFVAYAAGSVNMFSYYRLVAPLAITLIVLLVPALFFAAVVLLFRSFVRRGMLLRATLAVPALWVAIEYLSEVRSPHGTFGNISYSQMDFLPVIQLAAVTGIWGISFLLFLFPAAMAAMVAPGGDTRGKTLVAVVAGIIFAGPLGFGIARLHTERHAASVTVGLLDSDEAATMYPKGAASVDLIRSYTAHIPELAAQGAQIVVIPEKLGRFTDDEVAQTDEILGQIAKQNQITVAAGLHHLPNLNETRVYAPDGHLEAVYEKHHMLPAFESDLLVGTTRTNLERPLGKIGLTICKDMDFPELSRNYGNDGATLLLVPAWDFTRDGWLHSRMAILRGVESGFAIARAPRLGNLTITDDRGRVIAEQVTGAKSFDSTLATVAMGSGRTFYDRAGDWFAWFDVVLLAAILIPRWKPMA